MVRDAMELGHQLLAAVRELTTELRLIRQASLPPVTPPPTWENHDRHANP